MNAKNKHGKTPLHQAAQGKGFFFTTNEHIFEQLIDAGSDVNARDKDGATPLDLAIAHTRESLVLEGATVDSKTVDLLRKHGGKTGADFDIHLAVKSGNAEAVKQNLADGTDVNKKGGFGQSPLHQAALIGHKIIIKLLIDKGADVNTKNDGGETPLDWAIKRKHTETADLLRKHGAKTGEELKAEGK